MTKRIMAILFILIIMVSVLPAQAACSTPGCVKKAAQAAMDENDTDIALIIKLDKGCNGKGVAYMMYRTGVRIKCDRSGQVIVGKNEKVRKNYHYFVNRNPGYEKTVTSWKKDGIQHRWRWNIIWECVEDADYNLDAHSYIEYKIPGAAWKTCKGVSRNMDGVSMCKELAHYFRSMLDPDCPVVFL